MASFLLLLELGVTYFVCRAIYRLYFHPLAKVPGPKLAALTTWYCAYYDIIEGGQYVWKIKELHDQYGPVVRTMPDVVHVNDPAFIDKLYTQSPQQVRERPWTVLNMFTTHLSMLPTRDHYLHRRRRALISKFFSQANVRKLVPVVNDTLEDLHRRFEGWAKEGKPVVMRVPWQAATKDVIAAYAFGGGVKCLQMEDCNQPFFQLLNQERASKVPVHFYWVMQAMIKIPPSIMNKLNPAIPHFERFLGDLGKIIESIRNDKETPERSTIFHDILRSDVAESEKATPRMVDEAMVLAIAGSDTTALTMVAICYEILTQPKIFKRLRAELDSVMPDATQPPDPVKLDNSPYLNALIEEALRFYPSASHRQDRVAPNEDLVYEYTDGRTLTLPKGSIIGMTAPLVNRHPSLCDDPDTFDPDRYIQDPKLMHRHLTFNKGARQCLGMNLAYQELQTFTAGVWRKYAPYDPSKKVQGGPTMELYETTKEDVAMWSDFVTPSPKPGSPGVRVIVRLE
ncbi:cytochrome P450 [Emericellopsis atlantica]|uniref:Cytochrome P450 n=1 Tax=Emericellopsis atlantica TaxID=2614577 RepID=A0A9P7ZV45_9HYPO|nr:cytochrome P450 [Emericellopsis atlantica]KAG9258790.1 cytochrome P450 [Emericellopsis atlantica]